MPTQQEVDDLKAAYSIAEHVSQEALGMMAVARANVRETKKVATRARIRYHRALGALVAQDDDNT